MDAMVRCPYTFGSIVYLNKFALPPKWNSYLKVHWLIECSDDPDDVCFSLCGFEAVQLLESV